jgi:hypothetical protein
LIAVKRTIVTKGPSEPKIPVGTLAGRRSHACKGRLFIAKSNASDAAETPVVNTLRVGSTTSALRSIKMGACDAATLIWKSDPSWVKMMLNAAEIVNAEMTSSGMSSTTLPSPSTPITKERQPLQNMSDDASASLAAMPTSRLSMPSTVVETRATGPTEM